MTFEEFFTKKKIDLDRLRQAEPSLFSEFQDHFDLMGEKSFDHTKKFWFNKLRRRYHLKEAPKPGKEVIVSEEVSQIELLSSLTIDQMAFDEPLLNATDFSEEAKIQTKEINTSLGPKFTPRNIIAKSKETPEGEDTSEQITKGEATKAVGFKPRFKPKAPEEKEISKAEPTEPAHGNNGELPSSEEKPAYKPKFNLKSIPKKAEPELVASSDSNEENPTVDTPSEAEEKPAYKPKFNLKNIPKKAGYPASEPEAKAFSESKEAVPGTPEEHNEETKPAYKPRFNLRNIKPKSEE